MKPKFHVKYTANWQDQEHPIGNGTRRGKLDRTRKDIVAECSVVSAGGDGCSFHCYKRSGNRESLAEVMGSS
ncbi:hypothetical protein CAEBREN_16813 [Caenorhabditis brenneri]|uniref:Uncharacterized protein n=1 Tax=Caenorhabditis brenneri TaxID=135651 RepID=G0PF80_CAEBE|nr:hypothetical protein CAEBREN_16813 [Caenorhabditis brenneri]